MNLINQQIKNIKFGNSRVLYGVTEGVPHGWQSILSKIDNTIDTNSSLQYQNSKFWIYFFKNDYLDPDESSWVAREVVGVPQSDTEELEMMDFSMGSGVEYIHNFECHTIPSFSEIFELQKQLHAIIGSKTPLVETWRIGMDAMQKGEENQHKESSFSLIFQFFLAL